MDDLTRIVIEFVIFWNVCVFMTLWDVIKRGRLTRKRDMWAAITAWPYYWGWWRDKE